MMTIAEIYFAVMVMPQLPTDDAAIKFQKLPITASEVKSLSGMVS